MKTTASSKILICFENKLCLMDLIVYISGSQPPVRGPVPVRISLSANPQQFNSILYFKMALLVQK